MIPRAIVNIWHVLLDFVGVQEDQLALGLVSTYEKEGLLWLAAHKSGKVRDPHAA